MVEYGTVINLDDFGLEVGTPAVKSVGPLAFGPEGIYFHRGQCRRGHICNRRG